MNTRKQAFDSAMREIRKSGMNAKRNVKGCCRSCITLPTDKPIIWHYGGQGKAFTWRNDKPVLVYTPAWDNEETLDHVFFNHSGLIAESGQINESGQLVLDVFKKHGFKVEWDKTTVHCLEIVF